MSKNRAVVSALTDRWACKPNAGGGEGGGRLIFLGRFASLSPYLPGTELTHFSVRKSYSDLVKNRFLSIFVCFSQPPQFFSNPCSLKTINHQDVYLFRSYELTVLKIMET